MMRKVLAVFFCAMVRPAKAGKVPAASEAPLRKFRLFINRALQARGEGQYSASVAKTGPVARFGETAYIGAPGTGRGAHTIAFGLWRPRLLLDRPRGAADSPFQSLEQTSQA